MLSSFFAYIYITHAINTGKALKDWAFVRLFANRYLRLAPVYYAVFFFGWLVGPYLLSGPWWYTYQMGFCNCQQYWWSVLTMTINFFPSYMIANEGCYYWGWFVACEI